MAVLIEHQEQSNVGAGLVSFAHDLLSAWYGQPIRSSRVLVEHHERALFVVTDPERVVCKVEASVERARRERRALRELRGIVPVPEVLWADDGPPAVTVFSHIAGRELDRAVDATLWRAAGGIAAEIHRRLGATPEWGDRPWPEFIPYWIERETRRATEQRIGDAETTRRFNRRCTDALARLGPAPITTIHGDLKPAHVLHRGRRVVGLIDFGDYAHGDPAYDLVALTVWQPDRLEHVLAGYGADGDFARYVRATTRLYRPLRLLAGALWHNERGLYAGRYVDALRRELAG